MLADRFTRNVNFAREGDAHEFTITFVLTGPDGAVTWQIHAGWPVTLEDPEGCPCRSPSDDGITYHSPVPLPDLASHEASSNCPYLQEEWGDIRCHGGSWFCDSRDLLEDFLRCGDVDDVWNELFAKYYGIFGLATDKG